jgi:uncharacterized protein (DUF2236 family)
LLSSPRRRSCHWYASDSLRTIATRAEGNGREPILPPREEAAELIPQRGGITWRISGDARIFGASGYALLLQVAHPSVGAGVSQHSNFKEEPWGRLLRTLDYTSSVIYGGPELAWEVGRRVREMHKPIQGVRPDGERYHALEPGPYAWVHATLAEAIVRAHNLFCRPPLEPAQTDQFWAEWRRMGRLIGVRYEDLPETWPGLLGYFDRMVDRELRDTEAAQDVLTSLFEPTAPPLPGMRDWVWRVVSWPSTKAGSLATLGMLPPVLRQRLGVEWTPSRERRFRAMAAATRRARPLMPPQARSFGPHYLRWRREAIARGDVASGGRGRPAEPSAPATA